jgi:acyl-CoA reductase-like NAD-dependent aldehyde dehydrogenase
MSEFTMTIDGQAVTSPGTLKVINPATGEVFAEVPDCTREQLDVAMGSAQRAFRTWKDDYEKRRAVMYACADALEANSDELGRLATMEQGMPLAAGVAGVLGSARNFRYYADLDIPRITVQDDDAALIEVVRRPIGVIAAIKPWNVPIGMAVNTLLARVPQLGADLHGRRAGLRARGAAAAGGRGAGRRGPLGQGRQRP